MEEGYIQIKLKETNENLRLIEERVEEILKNIEKKEKKIEYLNNIITPKINEIDNKLIEQEELYKQLINISEAGKQFHLDNYNKNFKRLLNELNKKIMELEKHINYLIIDHSCGWLVLQKYLTDKKIVNPIEFLIYVDKYYDLIREEQLKDKPSKNLSIIGEIK